MDATQTEQIAFFVEPDRCIDLAQQEMCTSGRQMRNVRYLLKRENEQACKLQDAQDESSEAQKLTN